MALLAAYATLVAPYSVELTTHSVSAAVASSLTVIHLSDLHTTGVGRRERAVLSMVAEAKPDLIVITGDVVDTGNLEAARPFFTELHAPLGVFVVNGNWEHWQPPPDAASFYRSVGATLLVNEGRLIRPDVWLAGVDDALAGAPDFAASRRGKPADVQLITLLHSPAPFDDVARPNELYLAGHTHGGQVRVPLIGPLWRPPGSGRFDSGWYETSGAELFVSRGVGTSILPIRFACAPEVAKIVLTPAR